MQERRFLEADVDERGLHPREDALHAGFVDVADDPTIAKALDETSAS